MISAAAFCPHPPALVPAVGTGTTAELADLRAACRDAITRLGAAGRPIVVIGAGPATRAYPASAQGTFAGFGIPLDVPLGRRAAGPAELPLALTVGAWLVHDALGPDTGATGYAVDPNGALPEPPDGAAVLVMGDGSARRSTAAPGYLDERAEEFDRSVAAALASGDGRRLAAIDAALGHELLAAGTPAWRAAAAWLSVDRFEAELTYDAAPYGVGYFVAVWTVTGR